MQRAFSRTQCGFFNRENPNVGDPDPNHNHKLGKPRRARTKRETNEGGETDNWNNYSDQKWEEVCTQLYPPGKKMASEGKIRRR